MAVLSEASSAWPAAPWRHAEGMVLERSSEQQDDWASTPRRMVTWPKTGLD